MLETFRRALLTTIVSAGGFAALLFAIGRLWTNAYYEAFGLPTSDLQLTTEDYAFRAREALVMVAAAVIVALGVWWLDRRDAPTVQDGADSADKRVALYVAAAAATPLAAFVVIQLLAATTKWAYVDAAADVIQGGWRLVGILVGVLVGLAAGELAIALADPGGSRVTHLVALMGLTVLGIAFVPFAVVQLAQASAMNGAKTRAIDHAVIEFKEQAPSAIRRGDDPTRSVRVYVVLLTPERLAVAFPYPCRQIAGRDAPEISSDEEGFDLDAPPGASDVCDTAVFDRDQVRSVRVLGRGGRPSNDEPHQADEVVLAAEPDNGEVRKRLVFQQAFDFAAARDLGLPCGDAGFVERGTRVQGIWIRLVPHEAGVVSVDGGPGHTLRLRVDRPDTCEQDPPDPFQTVSGQDQLVYLFAPVDDPSLDVLTVRIRYMPLATVVDLTEPSRLLVAVEVDAQDDPCNGTGPTIAAPGVDPVHADCEFGEEARTATFFFEPDEPAPPGSWRVSVCTGGDHVIALAVTASPAGPPENEVAEPDNDRVDDDTETDAVEAEDAASSASPVSVACPARDY